VLLPMPALVLGLGLSLMFSSMLSSMLWPRLLPMMLGPGLSPLLSSMLLPMPSPILGRRLSSMFSSMLSSMLGPSLSSLLASRLSWMLSWILGPMRRRPQNIGSRRRGPRPLRAEKLAPTPDPDPPACTQMHGGQKWFRCALIRYRDAAALESGPRRRRQDGESQQFG